MKKFGLALSGGGFRASLYHLGLVRFLRDADLLRQVTHITSVSGGSILSAHLALNWDRYNGSASEFDAAAREFLAFVRLDVRNRITRRFPLTLPLRFPRWLLGRSNRKLTRTGLLEYYYENYLFGDTSLFQLPQRPQLHILATNLSEGCLCSFSRDGLLMMRRQPGQAIRIDRTQIGLATVAMAVTASSAYPGFFPPVELTSADVGAVGDEFGRHAYTDGGVFDNLGVRMFRCLERPLLVDSPLSPNDFFDFPAILAALRQAGASSEATPLHRIAQVVVETHVQPGAAPLASAGAVGKALPSSAGSSHVDSAEQVVFCLTDIMRHYELQHEPLFAAVKPADPDADAFLQASRSSGRVLDADDQFWLNRHLLETAIRQATGQPCFRRLNSGLDGVIVSDVGKPIKVLGSRLPGGLIRTALRSTDILMDRVWQLEMETFADTPGFVFAPSTAIVDPAEDPTALHPEIQRQTAKIRTDLDRFSPLEISCLVRHGYCVARKACRSVPDLFGTNLPGNAPWDPLPAADGGPTRPVAAGLPLVGPSRSPSPTTVEARALQASALRRIWSSLLDRRDWTSYIYVPLLVPILVLAPYLVVKSYQRSHRMNQLVDSLSQGTRDFEVMSRLLETKPAPWTGETAEEVHQLAEPDLKGFEILQDSRILDLRDWKPGKSGDNEAVSLVNGYRRLKVFKQHENDGSSAFRVNILATSPKTVVRFPPQQLPAKLQRSAIDTSVPGEKKCQWQVSYDFLAVPAGDFVDLIYEHQSPGQFLHRGDNRTAMIFPILADTAELTTWILMPEGREYRSFRIIRRENGKPEKVEPVKIVTEYLADDYTILAFKLLSLKAGYQYELSWHYK
jgi:predicted acylesterase/phospholipase RssA